MKKKTPTNKSEQVRSVLREIGAVTKKPPENWRASCEQILKERGVDVKPVIIYQQRSQLLRKKMAEAKVSNQVRAGDEDVGIKSMLAVKSFAHEVGGLARLRKIIDVLEELTN